MYDKIRYLASIKVFRLASLVKFERQGKIVYHSLVDFHVKDIFEKGLEHTIEKEDSRGKSHKKD
jgi:hypothetical protein